MADHTPTDPTPDGSPPDGSPGLIWWQPDGNPVTLVQPDDVPVYVRGVHDGKTVVCRTLLRNIERMQATGAACVLLDDLTATLNLLTATPIPVADP